MFQFSLETALNVRARQEKVKMKEMAEKLAIRQKIVDHMEQLDSGLATQVQELDHKKRAGEISITDLKNQEAFKSYVKTKLGGLNIDLNEADALVEEKRQALVDASRKRKTLEILEEREKKRYEAKLARSERMLMDEVASNLHYKNQKLNLES